jgi:hypothetical protein
MSLGRRQFLAAVAAGVVIHGLDRIAWAGDEAAPAAKKDEPPPWWKDALAEMKATKSPGVAIVLPEGKDARAALLAELRTLLQGPPVHAHAHLVEAVYVVVAAAHAGAREGETAVLLESDGKRAGARTAAITAATFGETIGSLLRHGDRLAARAKEARTPEVEKLLAALGGKDDAAANAAADRLALDFATAGPAVLAAELTAKADARSRISMIIVRVYERRLGGEGAQLERPLPFGTAWTKSNEPPVDGCPGCGMMRIPPHGRDALEFLAKEAPAAK